MADITRAISSAINIALDQIRLIEYRVNVKDELVVAFIEVLDDSMNVYEKREVTFFVTKPPLDEIFDTDGNSFDPPQYEPEPDIWFDLPAVKAAELVALGQDVLNAVGSRLY